MGSTEPCAHGGVLGACSLCFIDNTPSRLATDVAALTARAEKAEARVVFAEERMEVQSQDRARLALALEKAERERDDLRAANEEVKAANTAWWAKWKGADMEADEARRERNHLRAIRDDADDSILRLMKDRDSAIGERDAALATVARLEGERDEYSRSMVAYHDTNQHSQRELAAALATVERLEGDLAEVQRMADEWGNDAIALRATVERMRGALGLDEPWPARDVLHVLGLAADHLLGQHGCDCHGWEDAKAAREAARTIWERLGRALAAAALSPEPASGRNCTCDAAEFVAPGGHGEACPVRTGQRRAEPATTNKGDQHE